MSDTSLTSTPVWDRTTRWFHWINVICVICLAAIGTVILYNKDLGVSGEGKILLKTVHVYFGYVLAINLLWRFIWAFIGGPYARWGAFLPFVKDFGQEAAAYRKSMLAGAPLPYKGHTPPGRLMITFLYLALVAMAGSGLFLAGSDVFMPPFGSMIAQWVAASGVDPDLLVAGSKEGINPVAWQEMRDLRESIMLFHHYGFRILLFLVPIHVAAVVLLDIFEGNSLISAMFTGKKTFSKPPAD